MPLDGTCGFSVSVAGAQPLSYQWRFNGTDLTDSQNVSGAATPSLRVIAVQPTNAGAYDVVVRNAFGAATSAVATLTVVLPPSIVSQPSHQTVIEGAAASLQVLAAGSRPLSYQWFFNRTNVLAGATGATLIVANAQPANAGGYSVVVTNSAGAVTSVVAMLAVLVPPSIISQPADQTVIAGATARFEVSATGSAPLAYQWFFNQTNPLAGATGATLVLASTQLSSAGGYSVVVTNTAGAVTSAMATLSVLVPPSIVSQPTNQTVIADASAAFQVLAAGSSPLGFQWVFNQTNALSGATGPTLTIPNAQLPNAGGYSVVVTNLAGAITSAVAALTVLPVNHPPVLAPIPVQSVQEGSLLTLTATATDTDIPKQTLTFSLGADAPAGAAINGSSGVFTWTPPLGLGARTNYLTVIVTDDGPGRLSTSQVVTIIVVAQSPLLSLAIVSPANYAGFCSGQDIGISAVARNLTGTARVEFFAGDTLLGTASASPYSCIWAAPPPGDYSLSARITDALGHSAISPAVLVTVSDQCGEIAIVRAAPDPEIDRVQSYLFGIGLGSHVFDQAELTPQVFNPYTYKVVVWDDLGRDASALSPGTVDALAAAYTNGIPLYLIGERLASAAADLPEPQRTTWMGLTHLSMASGRGGGGVIVVHSSISDDKILHGPFATVTDIPYAGAVDLATNTDAGTQVMGTNGGADVLLAYPRLDSIDQGQTPRRFTQQARLAPPESPDSTNQLCGLFQNVVYWLLGDVCTDVSIYLTLSASPEPAQVGQPLELGIQVSAGAECNRTGVLVSNLVPAGVQFVRAHADQGTWSYDPVAREVSFFLGSVSRFASPLLTITVVPVEAGAITNVAGVRVNGQNLTPNGLVTLGTEVQTRGVDLTPRLSIARAQPNGYELRLTGAANVAYDIQVSADLRTWTALTNVLGPAWSMTTGPTANSKANRFYRAARAQ